VTPRRPYRRLVTACLTVCLLTAGLAACSSPDGTDTPPVTAPTTAPGTSTGHQTPQPSSEPVLTIDLAAINPCELVTKEEAEAILGIPVEEAREATGSETRSCTYHAPVTGPVGKVDVYVGQGAANILGVNRDLLSHGFTEVDNLGDEAYEKPFEFYFRRDHLWFFIGVVRLVPADQIQDAVEEAARRAESRV
jgi:hypothetical protein